MYIEKYFDEYYFHLEGLGKYCIWLVISEDLSIIRLDIRPKIPSIQISENDVPKKVLNEFKKYTASVQNFLTNYKNIKKHGE